MFADDPKDQEGTELSEENLADLEVSEEDSEQVSGGMPKTVTGGQGSSTESCKSIQSSCC